MLSDGVAPGWGGGGEMLDKLIMILQVDINLS